jgi:hypothetical protein
VNSMTNYCYIWNDQRSKLPYMKHLFLASFLWIFLPSGKTQDNYLIGYQNEVSGNKFTYHSPFSNAEKSLLSRANKDFEPIVWNTQHVPKDFKGENVSFVWLYGIDVTPTPQAFDFYVNDMKLGTFHSPVTNDIATWSITGARGSQLTFNKTMIDKHGDQMGFAVLTVPIKSTSKRVSLVTNQSGCG